MAKIHWYGPTLVLLLATLIVMIVGPSLSQQLTHVHKVEEIRLIQQNLEQSSTLEQLSQAFRGVAKVVEPSVVSIVVFQRATQQQKQGRSFNSPRSPGIDPRKMSPEELFERWFNPHGRSPFRGQPQQTQPNNKPPEKKYDQFNPLRPYGSGSGWVFDNQGHIITNNHVITLRDGKTIADEIKIKFDDGRERIAKVVGVDPKTDVAVIKVDGPVVAAHIATEPVAQGDMVFAFGSPFGIEFSMSQGIVSATNRRNLDIIRGDGFEDFIQTDAAINPGNSGGPLTNIRGQVIGMNTAIASRTGAFNGIGFAIPIHMVQRIAHQLIETGQVARGFLGIGIQDLDPKLARTYGLTGKGVLVTKPMPDSPADKAGLQANDIIIQIDGKNVKSASSLRNYVASNPPGSTLKIKVFRAGESHDFNVTLARRPDNLANVNFNSQKQTPDAPPLNSEGIEILKKLGIEQASTFTETEAQRFKVDFIPGVLVGVVRPGSEAQRKGLRSGTLLTHIMSAENSAKDLKVDDLQQLSEELLKHDLTSGVRLRMSLPGRNGWQDLIVLLELPEETK